MPLGTTPTHGHFVLSPVLLALGIHIYIYDRTEKIGDCEQSIIEWNNERTYKL